MILALDLSRYADLRPLLFHFTARENLESLRRIAVLFSASVIAVAAGRPDRLQRPDSRPRLRFGTFEVVLRDQGPLHPGHAVFADVPARQRNGSMESPHPKDAGPMVQVGAGDRDTIPNMSRKAEKVLEEALTLPPPERADLAATLLDSLDEREDEGVEEAWAQEVERRIQEAESGAVKMIPWSEARRRLRARLDAARRP